MKVRMLLKSGFGPIRHGEVFDATPEDAQIGIDAGVLAPIEPPPPTRDAPSPVAARSPDRAAPRKSFPDFCRAVVRKDSADLARNYDSHLILPETDHLAPRAKAALAESGGPVGGYTVPAEYAAGMMTVAAENAVIRPNATVAPMQSATLQVPYIDMTTVQSAGVSPYFGGVQMKWTGEAQTRTESEPQFKQVELKAWELSGAAVIAAPCWTTATRCSPASQGRKPTPFKVAGVSCKSLLPLEIVLSKEGEVDHGRDLGTLHSASSGGGDGSRPVGSGFGRHRLG